MTDNRQIMKTLFISNMALMFGFNVWRAVFNNLAVENLGMDAVAIGIIQSIREIPGLLGFFFLVMVALFRSELRSMGTNIIVLGVGLVITGVADSLLILTVGTLVTSIGFHYFYSGSQAVLLQVTKTEDTPYALGRLSSMGSLATFIAMLSVSGSALFLDNRTIVIIGGIIVIVVGLVLLPRMNVPQRYPGEGKRAREAFRREYLMYYALTLLQGMRRHIFTTFAIFLLVQVHGLQTWQTALLFLINSVANYFALPQLGRLVGRFGEQRVLTFNFTGLMFIFAGYAFIDSTPVLLVLFVLDNIFFGFNLAVNSYFQKIAVRPEDITPNMSIGQSINHVAAVIIPVVGGWLWATFDASIPFLIGAAVAFVSLFVVNQMRVPQKEADLSPGR